MSEILQFQLVGATPDEVLELSMGINRVGRAPDNDLVLTDGSVSSHHAEILVSEHHLTLKDLGSTNGTTVNGRPAQEVVLSLGDQIVFGSAAFQLGSKAVTIAIPDVPFHAEQRAPQLEDGAFACYRHTTTPAAARCAQCDRTHCPDCMRTLRRKGGQGITLCPDCSGRCEPLPVAVVAPKRSGLMGLLSKTIQLLKR